MKNKSVGQGLAPAVKKTLSLLLSLIMLFSITAGIDLSAYAATAHTQQEAVNWANAQVGKSLDQDGVYGAQCVDLIRYYYIYLGVSPVSGNGCDYATNALPSGWSRIKYYSGFTPQPGDVAVWTYASSSHGHVAIVTSANSSSMNVVEQNGSTHVTRSHSYNYSYGTFWGVIRPNFTGSSSNTAPKYANISVDKLNYKIDEKVVFTFNTDAAYNCNTLWVYCPDGSTLTYQNLGNNYSLAFGMAGYYEGLVEAWNGIGSCCSKRISWYVGKPQYAYISIDKKILKVGETVNFKFNTACKSDWNTLWIYYPDGSSKYYQYCGTQYKLSFNTVGEYSALVQAWNDVGECISQRVYFSVVSNTCSHAYNSGSMTKLPTCTLNGIKTYTCTLCGIKKTETISATGHDFETITTQASTKKNGSQVTKCTVCGDVTSTTTIYYPKTITLSTTSYTYNGKAKKPSVTVKDSKGKKIAASNYTVSYQSGRKNVGKYTVTIKFKGNYSGTVKKTFTIKPKATTLSSVTAKSKGFTAKWKKLTTQTTGYQIQYSTDKNFKKNNKSVTVSKNKTTSKAISKLTAKKKYYVRIRTYKTVKVNGKSTKIYSAWSKSKAVTTKK